MQFLKRCPPFVVLLVLVTIWQAVLGSAESDIGPSIEFWQQPGYVFLPSDLRLPLSFKILRSGNRMQSGAIVIIELSAPNHKRDPAQKFANFTMRDVCNVTESSTELQCQAVVDCRSVGLYHGFRTQIRLRMEDGHGSVDSEHDMSILIRSIITKANVEPPSCWRKEDPLHLQDPDCAWFFMSFKPNQNVVLSRQDFGPPNPVRDASAKAVPSLTDTKAESAFHDDLGGARSLHRGSWAALVDFMSGKNQTSSEDFWSCLPPVGYVDRTHETCAVVGSAWHLGYGEFGEEIDAHEVVLRVNDAPVEGWEEHVGSRTTHRIVNPNKEWSHHDEAEQLILRTHRPESMQRFAEACHARRLQPMVLSPSFGDYAHESFAGVMERSGTYVLTTGFMGVLWALHACESVTVYGMGGGRAEVERGWVQYVYYLWIARETRHFSPIHAWDDEAIMLMRLERAGVLRRRYRDDMEGKLRCAILGSEDAPYHLASPSNRDAHARICGKEGLEEIAKYRSGSGGGSSLEGHSKEERQDKLQRCKRADQAVSGRAEQSCRQGHEMLTSDGLRIAPQRGRRVAVCITGPLEHLPLTADNLQANVVKALGGAVGAQVDVLVHSFTSTASEHQKYLELLRPVEAVLEAAVPLSTSSGFKFCDAEELQGKADRENQLRIMYSFFRVNQIRKAREQVYGFHYDWVLHLRADVLFVYPIPSIETLSPDRITLPAFHTDRPGCSPCLNNRFAVGPADLMDVYMDMYQHMDREPERCLWHEAHLHHFLTEEQGWRRAGGIVSLSEQLQFVRVHVDLEHGAVHLLDADFHGGPQASTDPSKWDTDIHLDTAVLTALGRDQGQRIIQRMQAYWSSHFATLQVHNASLLAAVGLALGVPVAPPLPSMLRVTDHSIALTATHIARSLAAAEGSAAPFPHFFARGLFPDVVYAALRQQFNARLDWEDLIHKDATRKDGSSSRKVISLNSMFVDALKDGAERRFWTSMLEVLGGDTVRRAVFAALQQDESQYIGEFEILLINDEHDYKIHPHPDAPQKSITIQIYLPADSSRPHLGTTLYQTQPDSGIAQNQSFEIQAFKHMQYIPNAAYGFRVGLTSFHGFQGGGMGKLDSPRQSIILLYKRTISQFRERSYFAEECADSPSLCPWGPKQDDCYHQVSHKVVPLGRWRHSVRWKAEACPGGGKCCLPSESDPQP